MKTHLFFFACAALSLAGIALTLHIGIQDARQDMASPWLVAASQSDQSQLGGSTHVSSGQELPLCTVISPFSSQTVCRAELGVQDLSQLDDDEHNEALANRVVVKEALSGNVASLRQYVSDYSIACHKIDKDHREKDGGDCRSFILKDNDQKFVSVASDLAAAGVVEAQVALGQWYLVTFLLARQSDSVESVAQSASTPTLLSPVAPAPGSESDLAQVMPSSGVNIREEPAVIPPELQRAAGLLEQAASTHTDAQRMLAQLKSMGAHSGR